MVCTLSGTDASACWRLYEFMATLAMVPTYTDTSRIVYLVLLIAYASSIWNSIANG